MIEIRSYIFEFRKIVYEDFPILNLISKIVVESIVDTRTYYNCINIVVFLVEHLKIMDVFIFKLE